MVDLLVQAMDESQFYASLQHADPPTDLAAPLVALWYDARGDWQRAHAIVQAEATAQAAWVHAYLHRKEGDLSNAQYWYQRAGASDPDYGLAEEWRNLATALLDQY